MQHIKDKALRLIDYLTELARLRSKIIREIRQYQSVLWIDEIPRELNYCFTQAWGAKANEEFDEDIWIEVEKYDEPILDEIPEICEQWVNRSTLRNTKDIPELLSNINIQVEERNPEAEPDTPQEEQFIPVNKNLLLNDHPEISEAWEKFVDSKWFSWVDLHQRWQSVQKVYAKLFSIYQEQQKLGEEYELFLGLGFLSWRTPSGQATRRHLVAAKASLTFEAKLGKFIVMPAADGAQLTAEFDMLDIEDQPHHARQTAQEGLLSADDNPWDRSSVESVLKAIVNSLADRGQGEYHETLKQNQRRAQEKPIVEYAPALVLRKRSVKGLEQTLKKMREQIESGGEMPAEFIDLCEGDIDRGSNLDEYSHNNTEVDPKIYFPKPSNEEQRQIILKLQSATGVLVQGPPGTGKSHTIANLICHLLATGQRVLVTAKTPRGLQVLHDKLPKEMRHLCISLLGSGINEQRSLESSVSGILNRQDRWNDNLEANKTNELESKIQKLESEKAEINYRIRSIRESETFQQNIINGMYLGTAAKIALCLKEDSKKFCWFEDNISYDQELHLSSSEIEAMHEDLSLLKPELEAELQLVLPDPEKDMPSQDDFTHIVDQHIKAKNDFSSKQHLLDSHIARTLIKEPSADIKQILESVSELSDSISNIEKRPMSWIKNAVLNVLAGNNISWKDLLHVLSERMSGLKDRAKKIDALNVTIPDDFDRKKALLDAKILKKHFDEGEKNGWWIFKSKEIRNCRYINRDICIDSRPCSSYENLELLIEILSVEDIVDYCWNLWQGKMERSPEPTFLQVSELEELLKALTDVVSLCDLLKVSKEALSHIQGLAGEVVWHDPETVNKLLDTCRAVISRNHFNAIQLKLQQYIQKIESIAGLPNAHPVANEALTIIKEGNTKSYPDLLAKINDLNERSERAKKIKNFLNKLSESAPVFAKKLSENPQESAHHLKSLENAWAWARANSWLQDFLNKDNLPILERQLRQVDDDIKSNFAELSTNLAWKFCFRRMEKKPSSRRHLMGWQQAIKKVGKGTGKHAPKYRRDAQQHLNECRDAVPAWVMPLHRVYETVQPASGIFDVIIVDEASQCGPEALPLMYLAKRLLVVGDEQQISPEAVGVGRGQIFRLRDEYLNDFKHADSFDVESSLFDNGKRRFNNRIVLREHFRCMPEIIRFSNDLSYHATPLIPLRQYPPQRLEPLKLVHVPGGYREGSNNRVINRPEAEKLVETVVQCCNDDQYDDKTMGVITLQGDTQAPIIENMLLEQLGAEEMEQRRLICGKPYSFQGDERHIIFLSMVAAPNERIGPLTRPADQRRFNVAASRAQDQIWLFHTATRNDLSGGCLRGRLLEYFENPPIPPLPGIDINNLRMQAHRPNRKHGEQPKPFESWFEVDIALEVASHGFRVVPQYPVVENKRIDLVIEGTKSQLAVECDGDHWHGIEQYEKDMERQRMLERCGWRFHRIGECAYYSNPEKTLESLWQELEQLEIKPVSESSPKQNGVNETMHDRQGQKSMPPFESPKVETPTSIQEALSMKQSQLRELIIETLKTRPNYSCVKNTLHGFVLKQLHVISRGKPREEFSRKVNKVLRFMEKKSIIRIYKSKNIRVQLIGSKDYKQTGLFG